MNIIMFRTGSTRIKNLQQKLANGSGDYNYCDEIEKWYKAEAAKERDKDKADDLLNTAKEYELKGIQLRKDTVETLRRTREWLKTR